MVDINNNFEVNVNNLKTPVKRLNICMIKKQISIACCLQQTHLKYKDMD